MGRERDCKAPGRARRSAPMSLMARSGGQEMSAFAPLGGLSGHRSASPIYEYTP